MPHHEIEDLTDKKIKCACGWVDAIMGTSKSVRDAKNALLDSYNDHHKKEAFL